ncbi:hypothetical protein AAG570_003126 [Ranatra chinensis]|uniref:Exocyst complex component 2 n=1 Tax=Ranatra chinensis TaxID=642074 RepID=A0ABD0Y5Y8_9HEMI
MAQTPVVTGISPKEGPPGTKVTIRGENLGNKPTDLIGLTICGCDCLLSAEWKSPNKIIARSGPGKGRGDIIVTTVRGGKGTSTVQFRGYHETIGPLTESAVWVEETPVQSLGWGSRALSSSSFQIEDPLGLSVEGNDRKKFPEDSLLELFPGCNGDLASEEFSPGWFLLEHHHATSFDDLRVGLTYLKRKVDTQKEGQLSFLKGNVGSVIEQLETLENLKTTFEEDIIKHGLNRTETIESAIKECISEGNMLFDGVLKGREKADRTRNALGVLQRFRFLFTLPASIERNMKRGEYDTIINDYGRVNNLFGKTDVNLFKKVLAEVRLKVSELKNVLREKLQTMPNTLETQKKIIRNLVHLEYDDEPGWEAINVHSKYISDQLNECHLFHITAEMNEDNVIIFTHIIFFQNGLNHRVECVEDLTQVICLRLPDMWLLGQSYFNGELYVKPDASKNQEFKKLIVGVVSQMCRLVRSWPPPKGSALVPWLPHCLRHVRSAYSVYKNVFSTCFLALVFIPRLQCIKTALKNVGDQVKNLSSKENWVLIHDSKYGVITQLPKLFESMMSECLAGLKESVLQKGHRESELFENELAKKDVTSLVLSCFNAYVQCLDRLTANNDDGEQSMVVSQIATPTFRQSQQSTSLVWEQRVLACASNCRYSKLVTLPRVIGLAQSHGLPDLSQVMDTTSNNLSELQNHLVFTYVEAKSDPLVGTIEPSMYIGHFDWDTDLPPTDLRPYAKEIIANIIAVHAELEHVCSWLEFEVISQIVETVMEEVSRLMLCVPRMSVCGSQQARLDIAGIKHALEPFITQQADGFINEALEAIPSLKEAGDE